MHFNRLPFFNRIPATYRNHIVAAAGEFIGTFLFLFFAFAGTQVANVQSAPEANGEIAPARTGSNPAQLLYISLCFGFSLAVNVWVFYRISGGLFNPAVTLALSLVGAISVIRASFLFVAQIIGGIASAAIVSVLFPGELNVRTSLGGGTSIAQGLFIEMFLTAELVFTILMLAAEKHRATYLAPVGIGLALFVAELTGVYFTGGSLNPARSFAPAVVSGSFAGYHWIYWLGPVLGSCLAVGFYVLIKQLGYETANPGQDFDYEAQGVADIEAGHGPTLRGPVGGNDGATDHDGNATGGIRGGFGGRKKGREYLGLESGEHSYSQRPKSPQQTESSSS
ncbi:MAG: hypothetical protein M1814_005633 [Vezdaea aestivalis]|nr:MAG: hypothetical protein M1814_005633 [Vezdaea aestivalis]